MANFTATPAILRPGGRLAATIAVVAALAIAGCEESMSAKQYPELSLSGVWEMTDNEGMAQFLGIETRPGGSYCMHLDEFSRKGRIRFLNDSATYKIRLRRPEGDLREAMPITLLYRDAERDGHIEVQADTKGRPLIYLHFDDTAEKRKQYGGYNGVRSPGYYDRAGIEACLNELEREFEADQESADNEPGAPQ